MRVWAGLVVCAVAIGARPAVADEIFLSRAQAPAALFGQGVGALSGTLHLSGDELSELSQQLGKRIERADYDYLTVSAGKGAPGLGSPLGVVVFLDVVGQSLPIEFAVGVRRDGKLQDLEVLVYREPYGSEIRERRFRAQFVGKTAHDPLVVGKDIDAISGASISSQSAAYAARKGLALASFVFRHTAGAAP